MAETREAVISDGSDIEVDRGGEQEYLADLIGENELVEPHNQALEGDINEYLREILRSDDEDEEEFLGFQNFWRTNPADFVPKGARQYTKVRGLTKQLPENAVAVDYFYLFWDEAMWKRILDESKLYASQQRATNPPPASFRKLAPFEMAEMKTFVGLCLMMGILRLPKRADYWSRMDSCWLAHTKFGLAMSRNRFDAIWRYLHLQDNEAPNPQRDKLFKIREFLNILLENFKEAFTPGAHYTVDETMVKFKGRLSFRQYMPIKPIKWGVKIWSLAESSSGYLVNFQIYTGKENNQPEHGLSHRVVTDMCRMLQGTQSQVYFDNFFTGVKLLSDLKLLNIQACGTVRASRKDLPVDIIPKKGRPSLRRHQFKLAQRDDLAFAHWQDTKPVCVLSNFHDPAGIGKVSRRVDGRKTDINVPVCLADYQKYMKGVDLCDQMVGYYLLNHRSWKWWRRIFFHMLLASVHNAYVVAKFHKGAERGKELWPDFSAFVKAVAHGLVTTRASRAAPAQDGPLQATLAHEVKKIFAKKKVCKVCSRSAEAGSRSRVTLFGCVMCQEACHRECILQHIQHHNAVTAAANAAAAADAADADAADSEDDPDSDDDIGH